MFALHRHTAGEDDVTTVDHRHMHSAVARQHQRSKQDNSVEAAWVIMRDLMRESGTYLSDEELQRYKKVIKGKLLYCRPNMN